MCFTERDLRINRDVMMVCYGFVAGISFVTFMFLVFQ